MMIFRKISIIMAVVAAVAVPSLRGEGEVSVRSAAEDNFIAGLRVAHGEPREVAVPDSLELVDSVLLRLPGPYYNLRCVNASTYYISGADSLTTPVFSAEYPAESMANLFILPVAQAFDTPMTVTVLKHEPGEKETVETTVGDFVEHCRQEGCTPFWGVEKIGGEELQGALFLYNAAKGYDHVVKVTCRPAELFGGEGAVAGRVSLYVPTKNVKTLFNDDNQVECPNHEKYEVGKK